MVISRNDFLEMSLKYYRIIDQMPEVRQHFPSFERWLSPANVSVFNERHGTEVLSITGEKRWRFIQSPYAYALLKAWALTRSRKSNDDNRIRR